MEKNEESVTCKCGNDVFKRHLIEEDSLVKLSRNIDTNMILDEALRPYSTTYVYTCNLCGTEKRLYR